MYAHDYPRYYSLLKSPCPLISPPVRSRDPSRLELGWTQPWAERFRSHGQCSPARPFRGPGPPCSENKNNVPQARIWSNHYETGGFSCILATQATAQPQSLFAKSAALSCDTVKTRFSGSGGAGRSPVRKFYGQALFSRQNLHAIRPTAPRWIALIETCTKHAKQGECGAARGLQERTCLRNAVATAMDARSCGSSRPDAKHSSSTAALVQYACTRKTRTAPPCSHAGQGRCALQ